MIEWIFSLPVWVGILPVSVGILVTLVIVLKVLREARFVPHGKVLSKSFEPAHSTTTMLPIMVGKIMVMQPQTRHYPDTWKICVRGKRRSGVVGECTHLVTKEQFDAVAIGEVFVAAIKATS